VKNGPVGAELFHANGRTDRHEANSSFSQFCHTCLKTHALLQIRIFTEKEKNICVYYWSRTKGSPLG